MESLPQEWVAEVEQIVSRRIREFAENLAAGLPTYEGSVEGENIGMFGSELAGCIRRTITDDRRLEDRVVANG